MRLDTRPFSHRTRMFHGVPGSSGAALAAILGSAMAEGMDMCDLCSKQPVYLGELLSVRIRTIKRKRSDSGCRGLRGFMRATPYCLA